MMTEEEELLAYLEVKSAYQSQSIPGKNKFTFIAKLTGIPQVWTLNEKKEPIQYVELPDRVLSIAHSPNGRMALIGTDYKGNEKQQLSLFSVEDSKIEELVFSKDHFHYPGGWSPDGEKISYSSNRRGPSYFDVFVVDIQTNETEVVFQSDEFCTPVKWIDSMHLLITIRETNIDSSFYMINLQSKEKIRIGNEHPLARYQSLECTKNRKLAYLLTDFGEEVLCLSKVSMEKPELIEKLVSFENWDIEEIKLSPSEEIIVLSVNEGGISQLYLYNLQFQALEKVSGYPKGVIESLSWLNHNQLIFTLKSPQLPGDIWEFKMTENKVERLTFFGQSEKVGNYWVEPKLCSFRSFDELEIPYFYYGQKQQSPSEKPAILYVHGGPESQSRAEYHPVIQYLVKQGFAVAVPNVRGSNGYGRSYLQMDDGRKRMDSVKDLAELVEDLIFTHRVDRKKIGIMGRSYGGFMVLAALTHFPKLWAAGVDIVGISNFKTMLKNTGAWRRRLRECEYGSLEELSEFFDEIAPLHHSEKITAPLFVFHGRNDTRVPISEAEQLISEMKERKQEVDFIFFEDEGHQTEKIENHITMNQKTIEFFKKHLVNTEMAAD
ncbi:alpha/beta fold hydrolase [Robertmurraya massiliosenegalensis]|uniref:S9 family peptidase n=1 Tax=Robertmurraya TaxID=2837507 RepID=UPI0039A4913F